MTTAPDIAVHDEDGDETPPSPDELLAILGQKYTRAMAEPTPANPVVFLWQMQAAALGALAARAMHALNDQDPTTAARIAAWYHGPLGNGPNPAGHLQWLERFIARSPESFQQWQDEGQQAAAASALHAMEQRDPAALGSIVRGIASPEPCVEHKTNTPLAPEQEPRCSCARVGKDLHSVDCPRYTPGHDLASPQAEIERLRAEWRRLRAERDALRDRLNRVLDICDREQRNAIRWENPIPVPEWVASVQRAALGDDVKSGEGR